MKDLSRHVHVPPHNLAAIISKIDEHTFVFICYRYIYYLPYLSMLIYRYVHVPPDKLAAIASKIDEHTRDLVYLFNTKADARAVDSALEERGLGSSLDSHRYRFHHHRHHHEEIISITMMREVEIESALEEWPCTDVAAIIITMMRGPIEGARS